MSEEGRKFWYICFIRWTDYMLRLKSGERRTKGCPLCIPATRKELLERYGLRILFFGTPFCIDEETVFVFESERGLDNFEKFLHEFECFETPEARKHIENIRTIPVVSGLKKIRK